MNCPRLAVLLATVLTFSGCSLFFGDDELEEKRERLENPAALETADPELLSPEEIAIRDARRERDEEIRSIGSRVESSVGSSRDQQSSPFDSEIRGPVFVEVLWRVPAEDVTAFHLHYGSSPDTLDRNIKIPVENLERIQHPLYGDTFRYKLFGMSPKQATFVSLQAENNSGVSPRSPVLKIPPIQELRAVEPR